MTSVYLIRHADVENPRRVLYGHLEGFGLSPQGRRQAIALGRRLRAEPPVRIVHSPLQRAVETANLIADQLDPRPALEVEPLLVEAEFSRYLQGVPYVEIPFRRPLWFIHKLKRGLLKRDETIAAMGGRVLEVMFRLAREHPDEISACVSHADPLQAAWILLDGRRQVEREMMRRQVARSGLLKVTLEGERVVSVEYSAPSPAEAASAPSEQAAGAA